MKIFKKTGNEALLIAEGCKLNAKKKEIENRLAEIKKELGYKDAGKYTNDAKDSLTITTSTNYSAIDPKRVFEYLRRNKKLSFFPSIMKVQTTPLKQVIPETTFNKWRSDMGTKYTWIWK